jgi:hypothetical protein
MTEQPGRGGLGPAHSSGTVGDCGTVGVGVDGVGVEGTVGDRGTVGVAVGDSLGDGGTIRVSDCGTAGVGETPGNSGEDERTQLRAVMRDFGPDWEIERVPPGAAWVAVTRRGSWVHVIAAHDLDTLRTKIEAAEREETPPGAASPRT